MPSSLDPDEGGLQPGEFVCPRCHYVAWKAAAAGGVCADCRKDI